MNQTISPETPPDQHASPTTSEDITPPWLLDSDRELLRVLYAQRDEQLQQLSALQLAGARQKLIDIVERQIAMLNHAIRHAEEQAALHARQSEIRRVD
ncbi:MAG TPA: hypothetical protein VKT82_28635 [Ktedonobacterales bacterium]|nr:hypothetical protein [Ktedonobacterales bacterium]